MNGLCAAITEFNETYSPIQIPNFLELLWGLWSYSDCNMAT